MKEVGAIPLGEASHEELVDFLTLANEEIKFLSEENARLNRENDALKAEVDEPLIQRELPE